MADDLGRYDLLLAAIPTALLGAVLAGSAVGLAPEQSLFAGAVVAAIALFDGLFRRPPTGLGGPNSSGRIRTR